MPKYNIQSHTEWCEQKLNMIHINAFLTSATAIGRISNWVRVVHLAKMSYMPNIVLPKWVGRLGPSTWFNSQKPSLQSWTFWSAVIYTRSIQPSLDYACSVWGNCSEGSKFSLLRPQKRAARIVKQKLWLWKFVWGWFDKMSRIAKPWTTKRLLSCYTNV